MSTHRNKTRIAVAGLAVVALAVGLAGRFLFVSARPVHLARVQMDVYRVDENRLLVMGAEQVFLINTQERVVVRLSWFGRRYGPVVMWPRSSLKGVVLGDGVKGNEAESFAFDPAGVTIRYEAHGRPASVRVPLGHPSFGAAAAKVFIKSIGNGNTMVELRSPAMSKSVAR
jgi:hypothetical protein